MLDIFKCCHNAAKFSYRPEDLFDWPTVMRPRFLLLACLHVLLCFVQPCSAAGRLSLSGIGLTPSSRAIPGQVMFLMAQMDNSGDERAEGKVVVTVEKLPSLQSVRHVMVEPGQSASFELVIPLPPELAQFKHLDIVATVYVRDGDREVILARNGTPAVSSLRLPLTPSRVFGMAMEPELPVLPHWYWPVPPPTSNYEFATAARFDSSKSRDSVTLEIRSLLLNQLHWNGLDLFVIAEPTLLHDPAAVQVMREFMSRGGRIWVMVDKVPCALVRPLLGTGQSCEEVERVELNEFTIHAEPHSSQPATFSSDRDVPMARVVQSGGQVTHQVDGWPIAMSMNIGYGQLIITTLDSFAWIQPREQSVGEDGLQTPSHRTQVWATSFAEGSIVPRVDLPLSEPVEYPLRLIGNPVVPKSWVATALLSFCGLLAGLGLLLAYTGRLPSLVLVAPVVALVFSFALLLAASWVRQDIPESVSRLQLVDIDHKGSFASIHEQASVYLSTAASMQLDSNMEGIMHSSQAITSGVRKFVSEDFQKWHVANENWPPGTWRYQAEFVVPTQQLIAKGRLSAQGLEISLPSGLPSALEDPVLSYITGDPLLCQFSGDKLMVNDQVSLDGERWIAGSILSDEQQRRQDVYRQFFAPNKFLRRPDARLYGWTTPWPSSTWNRDLKQQGSALVSLPVELERPAIGQQVFVPHGLIQLRRRGSSSNRTTAFNDATGKWLDEIGMASQVEMEFVLPPAVVPLDIQAVDLELDAIAPQRTVTINAITESGPVEIVKLDSPSIPWKQTISNPAILKAFQNGQLAVNMDISNLSSATGEIGATSIVTWHIDHFHASVRGQMLPKSSLSKSP